VADVGLIRKRLRAEIDRARKSAALRRERAAAAERAYETFLDSVAIPAFRQVATVLRAESIPFDVQTPAGGVRLVSDRHRDAIELELDTTLDPPQPLLVSTHTRGSRVVRSERQVKDGAEIAAIGEDDVIERLIEELRPWLG
jgi:hypothetical protein